MADERGANGAIWLLVTFGSAIVLAVAAGIEFHERRLASQIDLDDRCRTSEKGRCFTEQTGYVESVATDQDSVTVRYDDGRAEATLYLAGDSLPESGSRIRLESWNNDVVSIYEPATERRYRTRDWPERGRSFAFVFISAGLLFLLVLGLRALLVFGVRALDRSGSRR